VNAFVLYACLSSVCTAPDFVEDRFELPPGFRIYKAARPDLCGASLDIAFDGAGRLLVGDGHNVRRLADDDGDGVYDRSEIIARGLGGRGPQGLLVYGDKLFAVGGDGVQLFEGYLAGGELVHRGRIGENFSTGGDHDAHQILRGHDGYVYFVTGNGGGARNRRHITEERSPARFERQACVFRISPDGQRWECIGTGGRNPPNLGMNYLGELFSLDSDMEWHVDVPWWRPVRLNHWLTGGDHGWQDIGAYPPYWVDCLPGILDVGRGSPDWGVFYEHDALPAKYRNAFLVCDYMSKSATTGGYASNGRLFALFLKRRGAGWTASVDVLARPKPGAKDNRGRRISFALVDIDVAPDGSLFLSDHNQGIWRLLYDPGGRGALPIGPRWKALPDTDTAIVDELLTLPQPGAEWSRVRERLLSLRLGDRRARRLTAIALDEVAPLDRRLRAVRALAPDFTTLEPSVLSRLSKSRAPELRGQAAWLLGLRGGRDDATVVAGSLLDDRDPFVRRRALEALMRSHVPARYIRDIARRMSDDDRLVRYAAMIALTHHEPDAWLADALERGDIRSRTRALIAVDLRSRSVPSDTLLSVTRQQMRALGPDASAGDRLDFLRILGRFREPLSRDPNVREQVLAYLLDAFPDAHRDIRWEQARLLGEYRSPDAFGKLVAALEAEKDPVTQFHLAQALARLETGWTVSDQTRAIDWLLSTQRGWFSEFGGKGLQFPSFWATVVSEFTGRHLGGFLDRLHALDLTSVLGDVVLDRLSGHANGANVLIRLYRSEEKLAARQRLLASIAEIRAERVATFLGEELALFDDAATRAVILRGLARQAPTDVDAAVLEDGLLHEDDDVFRLCAAAVTKRGATVDDRLARIAIARMDGRRGSFHAAERLLVALTKEKRAGWKRDVDLRHAPKDGEHAAGLRFWKAWYEKRESKPFEPLTAAAVRERSDEEVKALLLRGSPGGSMERGTAVWDKARCADCHGSGKAGDDAGRTIFGPELAGVTQRLSREEFIDSLVYPSKQVADRFKATVIQVQGGGAPLTGFVTEEGDDSVTLVDQDKVHTIRRADIVFTAPQESSLMPERLLSRLTEEEIRDLLAYLEELGAQPAPETE